MVIATQGDQGGVGAHLQKEGGTDEEESSIYIVLSCVSRKGNQQIDDC